MISWLGKYVTISALITWLGVAISAFGAVWVFLQENQYVGGAVIVVLIGTLVSAFGALVSGGERTKFESELREKSDEIAELNRTIASSVTGGDSFCFLAIGVNDVTYEGDLFLAHRGEYPLYDISFGIVDLQKFDSAKETGQLGSMDLYRKEFRGGNLHPNSGFSVGTLQLPNADEQDYNVFFIARNGHWTQELRFRRVAGRWKKATRVSWHNAGVDDAPVYEQIDSDFPRNDKGEVEWY